ncbi:hypothetical protein L3Q67_01150 [Saccharothrix sp. AJ9571]|nr:hypothetical protein L3Q67_01150 [Saccharothrix sp. AJ9571]
MVTLLAAFLLLETASTTPARAPAVYACADDRAILDQVSAQLGEDLTPITVLRSSSPHVTRAGSHNLPNYGAMTRADGRIHVGPHTPCELVDDTLRHEYVHVLQRRLLGADVPAGRDLELVADALARRWGNTYAPYIVEHGEPTTEHQHQADILDASRGCG